MSRIVVSAAFGEPYRRMAAVTFPNQAAYAKRIGAEFVEIKERLYPRASAHWEKLQLRGLLGKHQRVLWLDCDVILQDDCPDLFERVPEEDFGAWNEAPFGPWDYPSFTRRWANLMGDAVPAYPGWHANTGVMVLSAIHQDLFEDPPAFPGYDLLWDQGWVNYRAATAAISFRDIGSSFNHMFIAPGNRLSSYVIHYCGTMNGSGYFREIPPGDDYVGLIKSDLEKWKKGR